MEAKALVCDEQQRFSLEDVVLPGYHESRIRWVCGARYHTISGHSHLYRAENLTIWVRAVSL